MSSVAAAAAELSEETGPLPSAYVGQEKFTSSAQFQLAPAGETKVEVEIAPGLVGERSKIIAEKTYLAQPGRATSRKRDADPPRPLDPALLLMAEAAQLAATPEQQQSQRSATVVSDGSPQRRGQTEAYEGEDEASPLGGGDQQPRPSSHRAETKRKIIVSEAKASRSHEPFHPRPQRPQSLQSRPAHVVQAQRTVMEALLSEGGVGIGRGRSGGGGNPLSDYDKALSEFGDVVTNMMTPEESQTISAALSHSDKAGRGAAIFNRRRQEAEDWVVQPVAAEEESMAEQWAALERKSKVVEAVVEAAARKRSVSPAPAIFRPLHPPSQQQPLQAPPPPAPQAPASHSSRYEQHVKQSKEELNQTGHIYQVEEPIRRAESIFRAGNRSSSVIRQRSRILPPLSPPPPLEVGTRSEPLSATPSPRIPPSPRAAPHPPFSPPQRPLPPPQELPFSAPQRRAPLEEEEDFAPSSRPVEAQPSPFSPPPRSAPTPPGKAAAFSPPMRRASPGGSPLPQPFPASHNPLNSNRSSVERLFSPTPFGSQRLFSPLGPSAAPFSPPPASATTTQSLRRRTPSPSQAPPLPANVRIVSVKSSSSRSAAPPPSNFNSLPKSWTSFSESYRSTT